MRQLFRTTTAYRALSGSAAQGEAAHFTLVLFPDAKYLRVYLAECAKAFFGAEEGTRTARLIDEESYADCLFYPAAGGKLTAEAAGAISDESILRPVEGTKKLFVLDAFQSVTPLVQNKLLKLLEEPPAGVYFLAGATAEHTVLPTVLSRANVRRVPPFSEREAAEALARMHPEAGDVRAAAAACGGVLSVGEDLLAGGGEDFRLAEQILAGGDTAQVCRAAGERGKTFFAALRLVLRDVLLYRTGQERFAVLSDPQLKQLAARYPASAAIAAIGFVTDAEREIQFNANPAQAALALALRIGEERERSERCSSLGRGA